MVPWAASPTGESTLGFRPCLLTFRTNIISWSIHRVGHRRKNFLFAGFFENWKFDFLSFKLLRDLSFDWGRIACWGKVVRISDCHKFYNSANSCTWKLCRGCSSCNECPLIISMKPSTWTFPGNIPLLVVTSESNYYYCNYSIRFQLQEGLVGVAGLCFCLHSMLPLDSKLAAYLPIFWYLFINFVIFLASTGFWVRGIWQFRQWYPLFSPKTVRVILWRDFIFVSCAKSLLCFQLVGIL